MLRILIANPQAFLKDDIYGEMMAGFTLHHEVCGAKNEAVESTGGQRTFTSAWKLQI
jgi:hypothetical protein